MWFLLIRTRQNSTQTIWCTIPRVPNPVGDQPTQNICLWLNRCFVSWKYQQKAISPTSLPIAYQPRPLTSPTFLLHLSCPMQVSTAQKSSLDTAWQTERFQSASSLWKGYLFV